MNSWGKGIIVECGVSGVAGERRSKIAEIVRTIFQTFVGKCPESLTATADYAAKTAAKHDDGGRNDGEKARNATRAKNMTLLHRPSAVQQPTSKETEESERGHVALPACVATD